MGKQTTVESLSFGADYTSNVDVYTNGVIV